VTGRGGVPTQGVTAVLVQIQADRSTCDGLIFGYPSGERGKVPPSLTYWKSIGAAQTLLVSVNHRGRITLRNQRGATDLRVQVVGFFQTPN
jgi:hypothetical protein